MLSKEKRFGVTVLGIKGQGATFGDSISLLPPLLSSSFPAFLLFSLCGLREVLI